MPITASAKKALRQAKTRRVRNIKKKASYKEAVKTYRVLAAGKKWEDAAAKLSAVYQALDKAAKSNVIAKNKARRLKSRLSKLAPKK
jgi:small subunit ribosomal protein S20